MKLGQYRFLNDTHISVQNKNDEMQHVVHHEFIHRYLSGASTFGVLLIMMEKTSLIDDQRKWLFDELLDISSKMQEQTATFIEYFWILKNYGKEVFNNKIKDLKLFNKKYHNYFNFIYQYVKKEDITEDYVEDIIGKIKAIGIISLNIKIDELPFNTWKNKKDMQRFFSSSENNLKYNPNLRFEILIKSVFSDNHKNVEKLAIVLAGLNENNILEVCKSVIKKLYSDSAVIGVIMKRISGFQVTELLNEDNDMFARLSAFPSFSDLKEEYKTETRSLPQVLKELELNKDSFLYFVHLLGGLEGVTLLQYIPLTKYEDITSPYSLVDIIPIIKSVTNPIVFAQWKLYRALKNDILTSIKGRKIYIFMENSFLSSLNFIAEEFSSSKYIIIPEQEYDIVAICNSNHIVIQMVLKDLNSDIKNQLTNRDIHPANFIETTQFNYQEIKNITKAIFIRCNWAINNKSFGFK